MRRFRNNFDDNYNEEFNFFKKDNNSQELKSTVQLIKGTDDDIFDFLMSTLNASSSS